MFRNRSFRFSHEITVLSALAAILCYAMGYWQYTRYVEKKAFMEAVETGRQQGRLPLDTHADNWPDRLHHLTKTRGTFDYEKEMVLINRSKDNNPGVRVVTPLRVEGGGHVLVDRGFLPYDRFDKRDFDAYRPEGTQSVEGVIRPSKTKSFFLAPPPRSPGMNEENNRWLRLEVAAMAETLPYPILPVYIEQTNPTGDYPQYDPKSLLPPGRHLNYTFQWISFGSFALFFGFFLQFRPKRERGARGEARADDGKSLADQDPADPIQAV